PFRNMWCAGEPVLAAHELTDAEIDDSAPIGRELCRRGDRLRRLRPHNGHAIESQLARARAKARGPTACGDPNSFRADAGVVELSRDTLRAVTRDIDVLCRSAVTLACVAVDDERRLCRLRSCPRDQPRPFRPRR